MYLFVCFCHPMPPLQYPVLSLSRDSAVTPGLYSSTLRHRVSDKHLILHRTTLGTVHVKVCIKVKQKLDTAIATAITDTALTTKETNQSLMLAKKAQTKQASVLKPLKPCKLTTKLVACYQ